MTIDEKWRWTVDRTLEDHSEELESLEEKIDKLDTKVDTRFDRMDEAQRRSRRDILLAMAAFATAIVGPLLGYIFS